MPGRSLLIQIQRGFYDRLESLSRESLHASPAELQAYFKEYQKGFRGFQSTSSKGELLEELERANVVFCGDYHTLAQAQRTVVRLLRDLAPRLAAYGRKITVALEMLSPNHQKFVDAYQMGQLKDAEFLKKIQFDKHWGFPWAHYREIFNVCRQWECPVVGFNKLPPPRKNSLQVRDRFAARCLVDAFQDQPGNLILAIVGDLHLAENHLPREWDRETQRRGLSASRVLVHQNHETIYWKLVERGLENLVDVVKLRAGSYCIVATPPWIKSHSSLRWTEIAVQNRLGQSPALEDLDLSDEVGDWSMAIGDFLGLKEKPTDLFSVVHVTDPPFFRRLQMSGKFSTPEVFLLKRYVSAYRSFFIPRSQTLVLKTSHTNAIASESALYLHCALTGMDRVFQTPEQDFYLYVWLAAISFFGSRIINPRRKCYGLADLIHFQKTYSASPAQREHLRVAATAVEWLQKGEPRQLPKRVSPDSALHFLRLSRVLGKLLGHGLFCGLTDSRVPRTEIRTLFLTPFHTLSARELHSLYIDWTRRLDRYQYRSVDNATRF